MNKENHNQNHDMIYAHKKQFHSSAPEGSVCRPTHLFTLTTLHHVSVGEWYQTAAEYIDIYYEGMACSSFLLWNGGKRSEVLCCRTVL